MGVLDVNDMKPCPAGVGAVPKPKALPLCDPWLTAVRVTFMRYLVIVGSLLLWSTAQAEEFPDPKEWLEWAAGIRMLRDQQLGAAIDQASDICSQHKSIELRLACQGGFMQGYVWGGADKGHEIAVFPIKGWENPKWKEHARRKHPELFKD